jgi:hypothetical protein
MKSLEIERGKETPAVRCDGEAGEITVRGSSYPEDAFAFYEPVLAWIEEYLSAAKNGLIAHLSIDYINTSSSKSLFDLLDLLEAHHRQGGSAEVRWYYKKGDDDGREMGEEFRDDLSLPFELISV